MCDHMKSLRILWVFSILAIQGCAVSTLSQDDSLSAVEMKPVHSEEDVNVSVSLWCGGKTYGAMAFPIIPMPPIIPTFYLPSSPSVSILHSSSTKIISIYLKEKGDIFRRLNSVEDHFVRSDGILVISYSMGYYCGDLSGALLRIDYDEGGQIKHKELKIIYKAGKLKFEWGYLSA